MSPPVFFTSNACVRPLGCWRLLAALSLSLRAPKPPGRSALAVGGSSLQARSAAAPARFALLGAFDIRDVATNATLATCSFAIAASNRIACQPAIQRLDAQPAGVCHSAHQ